MAHEDYNGNFEIGKDCLDPEMKKARIMNKAAIMNGTLSRCCGEQLEHDDRLDLWICPSCKWMYDRSNQVVGIKDQIERRLGPVDPGQLTD